MMTAGTGGATRESGDPSGRPPRRTAGLVERAPRWLRVAGWASAVANGLLVVTGGAVRLTGSGLGCPTWPQCFEGSYTPRGELTVHAAIEFGNRLLTFALVVVALVTLVAAVAAFVGNRRREPLVLAAVLFLAIPAQAVIGGITVLTDLNPWIVSLHLLLSLAMVTLSVRLVQVAAAPAPPAARGPLTALAWLVFAATWVVLYVGTVVTGSGPHAGDENSPRNGLDPEQLSQLHADAVFLLLGLTIGLLLATRVAGAPRVVVRAVVVLLVVELAQGLIGFVQYLTDLPVVLVGFHMLGAALTVAAATCALLAVRHRVEVPDPDAVG